MGDYFYLKEYWKYVKNSDTKIAKKIYDNVLNKDRLAFIYCDGNSFYIETTLSYDYLPRYVIDHIRSFLRKYFNNPDLQWLWDMPLKY